MRRGALTLLTAGALCMAAGAVGLAAGCTARSVPQQPGAAVAQPPAPPQGSSGEARHPVLQVRNGSSVPICFAHITRAGAGHWGPDRLRPNEVIDPGGARGWRVPAAAYDVRLLGCDRRPLLDRRNLVVDDQGLLMTLN